MSGNSKPSIEIRDRDSVVRRYEVRIDGKFDQIVEVEFDEGKLYKITMHSSDKLELMRYDIRLLLKILKTVAYNELMGWLKE
jgi:WD40 repeat protein